MNRSLFIIATLLSIGMLTPEKVLATDSNDQILTTDNTQTTVANLAWRDGLYTGEVNGKIAPHGKGTTIYPGGGSYVGKYKNGRKHGKGTTTYSGVASYVGRYNNGRKHGKGTTTYSRGGNYVGKYKKGGKHGNGKIELHRKGKVYMKYDGTWEKSRRVSGKMELFEEGGKKYKEYTGNFRFNKRHGHGTEIRFDRDTNPYNVYEGKWKNDKRNGKGIEKTPYEEYNGRWKNDWKHGLGILKGFGGDAYIGEWKDNLKNNCGLMIYPDGKIYAVKFCFGKIASTFKDVTYKASNILNESTIFDGSKLAKDFLSVSTDQIRLALQKLAIEDCLYEADCLYDEDDSVKSDSMLDLFNLANRLALSYSGIASLDSEDEDDSVELLYGRIHRIYDMLRASRDEDDSVESDGWIHDMLLASSCSDADDLDSKGEDDSVESDGVLPLSYSDLAGLDSKDENDSVESSDGILGIPNILDILALSYSDADDLDSKVQDGK